MFFKTQTPQFFELRVYHKEGINIQNQPGETDVSALLILYRGSTVSLVPQSFTVVSNTVIDQPVIRFYDACLLMCHTEVDELIGCGSLFI